MSSSITGIARSAVPYGLPVVEMHRILMHSAEHPSSADRLPYLNRVHHGLGAAGPSPLLGLGADESGSWAWLDLRGGPVLVNLPTRDPEATVSAQVLDLYADVVGRAPRGATAEGDGTFLVRGPAGGAGRPVDDVLDCPTDLALLLVRTHVRTEVDPAYAEAVRTGIAVTPLGEAPPLPASVPAVDVQAALGPQFLVALGWMLELMPTLPQDVRIREELSGLGIGVGLLDQVLSEPTIAEEVREGLALGMQDVRTRCAALLSPDEAHGSREPEAADYLTRAARVYLGLLEDTGADGPRRQPDGS